MASENKIYGMLSTIWVELPPENEEQKKRHEEINREINGLARVFRAATDWSYFPYDNTMWADQEAHPERERPVHKKPVKFKSGDLVKVFKTVTAGKVAWQGTVDLDRSDYHHGWQENISHQGWEVMFADRLPAKLERNGETIYGSLTPHSETGTEGVVWCLQEYGKSGYSGLRYLQDGDSLTVYSEVYDGEVEWEGRLDFEDEKVRKIGWTEVMRLANHMYTKDWLDMSWQHRPVVVTPKPGA